MQYNIFVDEMSADSSYQIALIPSNISAGAMATRSYSTKESFVADLQRVLRYTDRAVARFFASDRHATLVNHPLSDEDATYLGWIAA